MGRRVASEPEVIAVSETEEENSDGPLACGICTVYAKGVPTPHDPSKFHTDTNLAPKRVAEEASC